MDFGLPVPSRSVFCRRQAEGRISFCRGRKLCSIPGDMSQTHPLTTTMFELPGYRVVRSFGVVRGIVVRSRSIIGNMGAHLQSLVGGNISIYTTLCERTREDAFNQMERTRERQFRKMYRAGQAAMALGLTEEETLSALSGSMSARGAFDVVRGQYLPYRPSASFLSTYMKTADPEQRAEYDRRIHLIEGFGFRKAGQARSEKGWR